MKQLIAGKCYKRVLDVYRMLRVRGYIGRGRNSRARLTTMVTCYGARAAEVGFLGGGGGGAFLRKEGTLFFWGGRYICFVCLWE